MTETQSTDLAAWLTAVWDEEERLATSIHDADCDSIPREGYNGPFPCDCGVPASVLARITADRKILAEHAPSDGNCRTCCGEPYCEVYWDGEEETVVWQRKALAWPCPTIRLKADQYASRPDRSEWLVERQGVEQ